MNRVDFIITSDWHLREDTPVCRTDDFWESQWKKVDFISDLQKQYDCPVIHAGDLFHHWKPTPFLLAKTMEHLPCVFYTIYGNHDLPQHNIELANKCGINVLAKARQLQVFENTHWLQPLQKPTIVIGDRQIAVWHILTYKNELPWYGSTAISAKNILKKYRQFDLIITGDNHQTFVEEYKSRLLVNAGSITRQTAIQIDHEPCVFLYNLVENKVKKVKIPIDRNVISREHIEVQEKRNGRIDAFISGLSTSFESEVSFQINLEKFFETNRVRRNIKQLVYKFIE